jgi:hypothetical protein
MKKKKDLAEYELKLGIGFFFAYDTQLTLSQKILLKLT